MHGLISRSRDRPSSSSRTTRMLSQTPTNPYLSYPDYTNSSQPFLGFDVSENRGLVAAATEDCTVRMYGLWTGKAMHVGDRSHHVSPNKTYSIGPRGMRDRQHDDFEKLGGYTTGDDIYHGQLVKCLRFVGGGAGEDYEDGLMVACGNRVDMWSWSQPLRESENNPR